MKSKNDVLINDILAPVIKDVPLKELRPFPNHPYKVQDNEEMTRLRESIREHGVLMPAMARPAKDGYELISGHRRAAACQALGMETIPVIVKDMTDDEATIAMVDANLQREHILPSEKAFAYKMKRDALNHQGAASPQVGEKLLTVEKIGLDGGDSKNQVLRYIRLTCLIPELLQMVDDGKIAFNPAVSLSYLTEKEQQALYEEMQRNDCTPSLSQSVKLRELSKQGKCDASAIADLMCKEKPNQREQLKIPRERLQKFLPDSYTAAQEADFVVKACEYYRKHLNRQKEAR